MNEAETRAELIDPAFAQAGWGIVEGSKILRERNAEITAGKIQTGGGRSKPLKADYILAYKGRKLAVVEAKSDEREVGEGVAQAKQYAAMLHLDFTYSTNGKDIYEINLKTGKEGLIGAFPTPEELWNKTFEEQNSWRDTFNSIPFEDVGGTKSARYYQEIAVNKTMSAIADNKQRILLTLATGTGKTFIAFQIAWKLFQSRWNLHRDGSRRPRILFLADRNILADQAFNAFSAFPEDALARIKPDEIKKKGKVPTNGSIFFTIFQTFMSGTDKDGKPAPYFGEYPADYFDFIVIDECHRGGANDEGNWRVILEYFSPAVQLGLTATPKRKDNVDTYRYFGEPVYVYSLKEGINDGFLTPFKVKRVQTTLDKYIYVSDDTVIEGEIEEGREYVESDFNRIIEIREREAKRVQIVLSEIDQSQKTIVFCATQVHTAAIRDLINQYKTSTNTNYCVRVTANDGSIGEQFLRDFQDNEKTIPTILTTSQKLSTGVDARNIRNIVLLRPVNSMIEFKQIVGRGTRLFDGKEYFTIYDFVDAYHHFADPEWDGEPLEPEPYATKETKEPMVVKEAGSEDSVNEEERQKRKKIKIKLRDGKEREIQHMIATSFWSPEGKPISAEEFLHNIFGTLPDFFKSEDELRTIWSDPATRKALLEKLSDAGYGKEELETLQKLINAEKSDLFDVLEYVSFAISPITRELRVASTKEDILIGLNDKQKEFVEFVLSKYIESGVEELDQEKLPKLLELKYHAITDAAEILGGVEKIRQTFITFQRLLYAKKAA
jgi:type I restriction enzyme R subunit